MAAMYHCRSCGKTYNGEAQCCHELDHVMVSLSESKKRFVCSISGGIRTLMAVSYRADEIGAITDADDNDEDDDFERSEKYIKRNILSYKQSAIGLHRYWFSVIKFERMIEYEDYVIVKRILSYLDSIDFGIKRILDEASLSYDDMDKMGQLYADDVNRDIIRSFEQLCDY